MYEVSARGEAVPVSVEQQALFEDSTSAWSSGPIQRTQDPASRSAWLPRVRQAMTTRNWPQRRTIGEGGYTEALIRFKVSETASCAGASRFEPKPQPTKLSNADPQGHGPLSIRDLPVARGPHQTRPLGLLLAHRDCPQGGHFHRAVQAGHFYVAVTARSVHIDPSRWVVETPCHLCVLGLPLPAGPLF